MTTAEEFLRKSDFDITDDLEVHIVNSPRIEHLSEVMIEFAKLHVQAALEAAKKASIEFHEGTTHLEQEISRAYPITLIK